MMIFKNVVWMGLGAAVALAVGHYTAQGTPPVKAPDPPQAAASATGVSNSRRNAIVIATEETSPAVVSVNVRRSDVVAERPSGDPFFDFFGPQLRRREISSLGSGFIVDHEGHILTNAHVLGVNEGGELQAVWVTLPDGRQFPAKVVGADADNDIAVLSIQAKNLPVARLQTVDDNLIGEWVVAIGNPFGYLIGDPKPTVTVGVISAVRRSFSSQSGIHYFNMIQTDASINPGNSGGPLVNTDGKVIGINTFILTGGGSSQGSIGLGFAIPIEKAKLVMDELLKYGTIRQFTTGLYAEPDYNPHHHGVTVARVDAGSPADKAGLQAGDVLYAVAGKRIDDLQDVLDLFRQFQVGEKVEILYRRHGQNRRTEMTLQEAPRSRSIF